MSSSSDSSSEDDIPLAQLKRKESPVKKSQKSSTTPRAQKKLKPQVSGPKISRTSTSSNVKKYRERDEEDSTENEWDEDDDQEEDVSEEDSSSEDDDSDNEPISSKKRKLTPEKSQHSSPKKKLDSSKKEKSIKKTKKLKKSKSSTTITSSSSATTSGSTFFSASSELYTKCDKGKLIMEFLRRWWYVMTWPNPKDLPDKTPENCDAMDGFPGVYVVTSGEDVGKILDLRDKKTCPNFINMVQKSSEELKELLLKAVTEQKRVLIEHEGVDTQTEKDLKMLEKWVHKLNPAKADKEAEKVLKAAGLKINKQ